MHAHIYKPSLDYPSWDECETCQTLHNTVPFAREGYLDSYWDESKGHSTLRDQRHNVEVIENEKWLTKVRSVLQYCKKGTLLELACAPGSLLRIAQEEGFDVMGVEPDDHYAGAISEYAKAPVIVGFFEDIDFAKDQYLNIVAMDLVEHVSEPEKFIEKCFSILEPGGILVLMLPTTDNFRICDIHPEHIHIFSQDYLIEMLIQYGAVTFDRFMEGHTIVVVEKL